MEIVGATFLARSLGAVTETRGGPFKIMLRRIDQLSDDPNRWHLVTLIVKCDELISVPGGIPVAVNGGGYVISATLAQWAESQDPEIRKCLQRIGAQQILSG